MLPVLRNRNRLPGFAFADDFDRFFNVASGGTRSAGWAPAIDVTESDEDFVLVAEVPGLSAKEVEITVENGVLSISGEKRGGLAETDVDGNRRVVERRYGKFSRSYSLPRAVDGSAIKAGLENGLLTVRLPKSSDAKPHRIKIG